MIFALVFVGLILIFSNVGTASASTVTNGTFVPTINSINPVNNAVNIQTNQKIKIKFNKEIKFGKTSWIEFKNSNGTAVSFTKTINGSTLYLTPKSQLAHQTTYTIVLHSGSIQDLVGNGIKPYSTKFTTIQTTKTYSANGISFNYPSKWMIDVTTQDGVKIITGLKGYNASSPQFQIAIDTNPRDMTDQDALLGIAEGLENMPFPSGYKLISKQTYTLNGNKGYGLTFTINNKQFYPETMKDQEISLAKNHKTYTIDYIATLKDFNNEKINFDIINQSLKFK